jgi:hypothetical protein
MAITYEPITTTTLGSATTTFTLNSIPATYTDLRLVLVVRDASTFAANLRFNSDTGSNYSYTRLTGNGSSASSNQSTSNTYIGLFPCTNAANTFALKTVDIFSYAGSTFKTCLVENSGDENGSGSVDRQIGLWRSTSAITSITIVNAGGANFQIGTTATLYGIKEA